MSSDQNIKKRRLETSETPKSISAISAIAALRRGTASASRSAPSTPEADDKPVKSNVNYFSPLQKCENQNGSPKPPQRGGSKPRRQRAVDSPGVLSKEGPLLSDTGNSDLVIGNNSSRVVQYSSFRLSKSNHRTKAGGIVELRLEDNERFLVLGSFGIRVIQGEVTIAGASLRPSEDIHWVHGPHCHALPVLRTSESTRLELHPDPNSLGLRQLGKLSPLFRKLWNELPESGNRRRSDKEATFQILYTSEDAPKCIIQSLMSPAEWNRKLATLVTSTRKLLCPKLVICGPKSAGKSTFSKLLANRLVTDRNSSESSAGVAVLDLDPGQPEYTPAGMVSLIHLKHPNLGTPFTHPGVPEAGWNIVRSHALASVTPASDPELYLECAIDLFETYKKTLAHLPLIINTPGWILGTGLDLLSEIISTIEPNEVIYMSEDGPAETVEGLRAACTVPTFTELPSQQSEFTSRTAAHLRAMQAMSYFHVDSTKFGFSEPNQMVPRIRWNPTPLSSRPPLLVRHAAPNPGILGILSYEYQSPPDLLVETINGMILALVEIEDNRAFRGLIRDNVSNTLDDNLDLGDDQASISKLPMTPEGLPYLPNPNGFTLDPCHSQTIGLVLVRGVDSKNKVIQLLTPIPPERLRAVMRRGHNIVLVNGKFDAPNWAYTEDLYERADGEEGQDDRLEVTDEDTSEDDSDAEPEDVQRVSDIAAVPWVEVLKGNEKRPVGSRVWRVRRDLGRQNDG